MPPGRDPTEFLETFGALKRCLSALGAQAYAEARTGTTQARFLRHIGARGQTSQAQLARATRTDPTLTGRALRSLIARGLVRRKRSETDRREYVLELSASGRRARIRVEKLRAALAARVVGALDERDLEDFERITGRLLAAFEAPADGG